MKYLKKFEIWYTEQDSTFGAGPKFRQDDIVKINDETDDFFIILYMHHDHNGYIYHLGKITKDFDIISIESSRLRIIESPVPFTYKWILERNLIKVTDEEKDKIETGLNAKKYNL